MLKLTSKIAIPPKGIGAGRQERGSAVFSERETLVQKKTNPEYSEIHHGLMYNKRKDGKQISY